LCLCIFENRLKNEVTKGFLENYRSGEDPASHIAGWTSIVKVVDDTPSPDFIEMIKDLGRVFAFHSDYVEVELLLSCH